MKNLLISLLVLFCLSDTYAQIGVKANGTAPIPSAQLEVQSTTKAFYPPRMNTAQKNAIAGVAAGAMVFDTDLGGLFTYNGSSWVAGSGLTLPYSVVQSVPAGSNTPLFSLTISNPTATDPAILASTNSSGSGSAIYATATYTNPTFVSNSAISGVNLSTTSLGYGVYGSQSGTGSGVHGRTTNGTGVFGLSTNGTGVDGVSTNGTGVHGNGLLGGYFSGVFPTYKALETSGGVRIGGSGVGTLGADKFLKSINANGDAQWSDLLPYSYSGNFAGNLMLIQNTNTTFPAHTIYITTNSVNDVGAVYGVASNSNPTLNPSGVMGVNNASTSKGYGVFGEHNGNGGTAIYGTSVSGYGVTGESTSNYGVHGRGGKIGVWGHSPTIQGVQGSSISGIGGLFTSSTGYALVTDVGKVGLGQIPSLNADERVDINGRLRIRSGTSTAGVWFNNVANSIAGNDGAFYGMKLDTETGIFIGGNWRFWVNNVGNATLLGILTQTSDRRLKKDFSLLNNSLSDIYQLKGYHYKWIEASRSKDLQTGLIAQEVQKIFPELVQTDEKGFLSVNYIGLIPHLIEAAKELKNENVSLKSRLDKIEAMLTNSQLSANNVINK
jgi:hypothetical protein